MRLLIHFLAVISLFLLVTQQKAFATTFAYFTGVEGKITKLDTDTNAVTQLTLKMPDNTTLDSILGSDTVNNYIYISHCSRLGPCKVGIYGLKTLDFIKELPLTSLSPNIQMLIYPDGSKFLINYLLPGSGGEKGGYTTDLYDGKTLNEIRNLSISFGLYKVMFSKDGKKIYSIIGGDYAKVDTIDSTTYEILVSKDLTQIWRKKPEVFSSGIESFGSGKILIFENVKTARDLPTKLDLYTYDIGSKTISPKVSTGLKGDSVLIQDGTKIIFDENQVIRKTIEGESEVTGFKSLGSLHIYDVATGNQLGLITFQVQGHGEIIGIRPAGDRLYYQSKGETEGTSIITVMDIKDYSVVTTISLSFDVLSVVFFDE